MTFSTILLQWYYNNARSLPWRESKNPYHVWLSEIILQQTRVDQGLPYYLKFVEDYPSIVDLHKASEDQVLKLWQGLGYYSRARNLREAARQIVEEFNGQFPDNYKDILSLKGVGPYTAAAISSICFDLPHAVVDGNVYRVLSRYFNENTPINSTEGSKLFAQLAQENLSLDHPGDYNQAIMEFGALLCVPVNPDCNNCPLRNSCIAFAKSKVHELPVKLKKLKVKDAYLHYFLMMDDDYLLIEKRDHSSIWKGLYHLPLLETPKPTDILDVLELEKVKDILPSSDFVLQAHKEVKHKLTHRNLHIRFYKLSYQNLPVGNYLKIQKKDWKKYAFPKPIVSYLSEILK